MVAYPGVHRGAMGSGTQAEYYDLFWHSPILSPYVKVEVPIRWDEDKLILEPISGKSETESRRSFAEVVTEEVKLPSCNGHVSILQERLKDVARLLVYGPSYRGFRGEVGEKLATVSLPENDNTKATFDNYLFPDIAAFFSRAYCCSIVEDSSHRNILDAERQKTLKVIETMFRQFSILQEPFWIKATRDDWVDDIAENIKAVQTLNELLAFEKE